VGERRRAKGREGESGRICLTFHTLMFFIERTTQRSKEEIKRRGEK